MAEMVLPSTDSAAGRLQLTLRMTPFMAAAVLWEGAGVEMGSEPGVLEKLAFQGLGAIGCDEMCMCVGQLCCRHLGACQRF